MVLAHGLVKLWSRCQLGLHHLKSGLRLKDLIPSSVSRPLSSPGLFDWRLQVLAGCWPKTFLSCHESISIGQLPVRQQAAPKACDPRETSIERVPKQDAGLLHSVRTKLGCACDILSLLYAVAWANPHSTRWQGLHKVDCQGTGTIEGHLGGWLLQWHCVLPTGIL